MNKSAFNIYFAKCIYTNYILLNFIKRVKQTQFDNYKVKLNKINNEFNFKPINTRKINIDKYIGTKFRQNILSIIPKNPIHIKPEHLLKNIHETHLFITEKADGVHKKTNITNLIENVDHNSKKYTVEYEEMSNIKILINITNNNKNVFENSLILRNYHPCAPIYDDEYVYLFNNNNFESIIEKEKVAFNNYIKENQGKTNLWWPKLVWIINEKQNYLDYIKHLTTLHPLNIFKTDGYILYSINSNDDIYKIKPHEHLSIDLKFIHGKWYNYEG